MGQRKVLAWETGLFDRLDLNVGQEKRNKVSISGRLLWAECKELWETRDKAEEGLQIPYEGVSTLQLGEGVGIC